MVQRWAVLFPNEDGRHFRMVRDAKMYHMLGHPEEYGIKRFAALDGLDPDPAVWEPGTAVLMRVEVVVPEAASGYKLPEYAE